MKVKFDSRLKANLSVDENGVVRGINHCIAELYSTESDIPRLAALEYLRDMKKVIELTDEQIKNAHQWVSFFEPMKQGVEYRLSEEKTFFDSTTLGFFQTYHNVPVWKTGMTVTVKHGPNRIVSMANTSQKGIKADLPEQSSIDKFLELFKTGSSNKNASDKVLLTRKAIGEFDPITLNEILGVKPTKKNAAKEDNAKKEMQNPKLIRGRFYLYKYESKKRVKHNEEEPEEKNQGFHDHFHDLKIPPVSEKIKDEEFYMVAELTFSSEHMTWLMLVELETKSILYIEPLSGCLNGLVFLKDPISKTGVTTNTANQTNAVLNQFRDDVVLPNLDAPVSGTQNLKGRFASIVNVEDPNVVLPTRPSGSDFDFNVRTNDFAAVNAYYHTDRFFTMVESLGFSIASYFPNTDFPISIDHRGLGNLLNAHCVGNGTDGIQHCCYALADLNDTTNPIGIALDNMVVIHELGGHGVLYEHVGSANFGFAHSAGDSLGVINNDPDSALRGTSDRYWLTPWVQFRRFDRDVSTWAWGSAVVRDGRGRLISGDDRGYGSESILATTLFRIYRSIGGDSDSFDRRKFAADMMTYLILRTISTFTPMTNPNNALAFCNAMMCVDRLNWTTRGIFGGAYNKVIRWSFEKQGLFQPPTQSGPVSTAGSPPDVDVYIEDGRNGEYQFQPVHWNCQVIWNRVSADAVDAHQEPILGQTNYAYVKVKNRGTQSASNVKVRGFHSRPGAGLVWPNDLEEMPYIGPAFNTFTPLNGNSSEERIVGPFAWIPTTNSYGHDCIIMIANATGDKSNIDNFTIGEHIEEWRLVPNDNNIAQRNVVPVPGGGGMEGLVLGLHRKSFWVGNPNRKPALMTIDVQLPDILARKNWKLSFVGVSQNQFRLKPNEKKELIFNLEVGENFSKREIEQSNGREIILSVSANGALIGGMTYYIDSELKMPVNELKGSSGTKCIDKAKDLLDCLNLPNQDVKKVKVRKVSIDIEMNDGC